jgi:hypothetical protein
LNLRKVAFSYTIAVFIVCSLGILISKTILQHSIFLETAIIAIIFLFCVGLIPIIFPKRKLMFAKELDIFTGGIAKPPYLTKEEIYVPSLLRKPSQKEVRKQ